MKEGLFGENVNYSHIMSPFILIALLNRFDNRYQSAADAFFNELSWKQMFFLNGITLFETAPTIKDMADLMGCSHQNANKLYAKVLRDGYLSSAQDEADRRKQRLFLTEKGKAFLTDNHVGAAKSVNEVFSVVNQEEIELVIDVMDRLTKRLETMIFNEMKGDKQRQLYKKQNQSN